MIKMVVFVLANCWILNRLWDRLVKLAHLLSELLNPRKVIISNDTTLAQTDMFFLESGTASYVSYQGQNASSVFL